MGDNAADVLKKFVNYSKEELTWHCLKKSVKITENWTSI